jgi:GNAT superfamily N-acetyltransferase
MMRCIRILRPSEWASYEAHLLRLDDDARRLRFGYLIDDDGVRAHVARLDPSRDRVLALARNGWVIAAVHIAIGTLETGLDGASAELAFSVDRSSRGQGAGRALLDRALLWSRNRGVRRVWVLFLNDNHAMSHLARRARMSITNEASERVGEATLPPMTPFSLAYELLIERWALWEEQRSSLSRPLVPRPAF